MAKQVRINVVKKFTLVKADHTQENYEPGAYDVEKEVADHWYVKEHCGSVNATQAPTVNDVGASSQAPDAPAAGAGNVE